MRHILSAALLSLPTWLAAAESPQSVGPDLTGTFPYSMVGQLLFHSGDGLYGGSGTVIGAFLGAILIEILDLSLVRVPQVSVFWRDAVLGALILGAIILDLVVNKRFRRRRGLKSERHTAIGGIAGDA